MEYFDTGSNALKYCNGTSWLLDGTGGTDEWTVSGSNIYYNAGNVGIGTTAPTATLTLGGQENWATGLGAITQILGPTDQGLIISAAAPASGSGNSLTLETATPSGNGNSGSITMSTGSAGGGSNSLTGSITLQTANSGGAKAPAP